MTSCVTKTDHGAQGICLPHQAEIFIRAGQRASRAPRALARHRGCTPYGDTVFVKAFRSVGKREAVLLFYLRARVSSFDDVAALTFEAPNWHRISHS
jgi:hypothetical protein